MEQLDSVLISVRLTSRISFFFLFFFIFFFFNQAQFSLSYPICGLNC